MLELARYPAAALVYLLIKRVKKIPFDLVLVVNSHQTMGAWVTGTEGADWVGHDLSSARVAPNLISG